MTISNDQVSVSTSATEIETADAGAANVTVIVKNTGSANVFLGDANVTTGNGYRLAIGDVLPVPLTAGEALYGIVASGSEDVHKLVTGE